MKLELCISSILEILGTKALGRSHHALADSADWAEAVCVKSFVSYLP